MIVCPEQRNDMKFAGDAIIFESETMKISGAKIILNGQTLQIFGLPEFKSNEHALAGGLAYGDCYFADEDHPIGFPVLLRVVDPKPLLIKTLFAYEWLDLFNRQYASNQRYLPMELV